MPPPPSALPRLVGHRGAPRVETENTLASILAAARLGADAVEIDIRATADGDAVVLHDETLARLWGDPRAALELTAAEIASITRGGVPRLSDALDLAAEHGIRLLVDLTGPVDGRAGAVVVSSSPRLPELDWCGAPDGMAAVREVLPEARVWLAGYSPAAPVRDDLTGLEPVVLNLDHRLLSPELVSAAHGLGLEVSCWTVDDPDLAQRAAALGVDSITTNDLPAIAAALR